MKSLGMKIPLNTAKNRESFIFGSGVLFPCDQISIFQMRRISAMQNAPANRMRIPHFVMPNQSPTLKKKSRVIS